MTGAVATICFLIAAVFFLLSMFAPDDARMPLWVVGAVIWVATLILWLSS